MLNTIITCVLTGGAFSFFQFLIQRHDKKKAYVSKGDIEPISDACEAIIQDRLEHLMTKYLQEGEMTATQFKAVNTLLKAYEGLGGDDYIHGLYDQLKTIPIK